MKNDLFNMIVCFFFIYETRMLLVNSIKVTHIPSIDTIESKTISFISNLRKAQEGDKINSDNNDKKEVEVVASYNLNSLLNDYLDLNSKYKSEAKKEVDSMIKVIDKVSNFNNTASQIEKMTNKYDILMLKSELSNKELKESNYKNQQINQQIENIIETFDNENDSFSFDLKGSNINNYNSSNEMMFFSNNITDFITLIDDYNSTIYKIKELTNDKMKINNEYDAKNNIYSMLSKDLHIYEEIAINLDSLIAKKQQQLKNLHSSNQINKLAINNNTHIIKQSFEKDKEKDLLKESNLKISSLNDKLAELDESIKNLKGRIVFKRDEIKQLNDLTNKRIDKLFEEMSEIVNKMKSIENESNERQRSNINFLKDKFRKIKNLVLILNKLLFQYKSSNLTGKATKSNEILNNLLFEQKGFNDLKNDINFNLLEQVTSSILNIN